MSKIFKFSKIKGLTFFLLLITTLILINPASAEEAKICQMTTDPPILTTGPGENNIGKAGMGGGITFTIHVDPGYVYDVYFQRGGWFDAGKVAFENLSPNSSGDIVFRWGLDSPPGNTTSAGTHPVEVIRHGAPGNYCPNLSYEIKKVEEVKQVSCNIQGPKEANTETPIKLSGKITPVGKYRFFFLGIDRTDPKNKLEFNSNADGSIPDQNFGIFNKGTYQIQLQKKIPKYVPEAEREIDFWENVLSCKINSITVFTKEEKPNPDTTPTGIGSGDATGPTSATESNPTVSNCTESTCSYSKGDQCGIDKDHPAINTAIGCIPTNPTEFIQAFLKFILGIAGGFAFLMMLLGAFQMLTSAGNPDNLKNGRDRLQSAIIGLLFVIFSVLLLQIIGANILAIPGFK